MRGQQGLVQRLVLGHQVRELKEPKPADREPTGRGHEPSGERHGEQQHVQQPVREPGEGALVGFQRIRQRGGRIVPAPRQPQQRQHQDGDADGLVTREQRELLGPGRQRIKEGREGELCDDEQHDEPVQQLGNGAPAARGVSQDHNRKLMRLNASCLLQRLSCLACAALLAACPAPPRVGPSTPAPAPGAAAHTGTP